MPLAYLAYLNEKIKEKQLSLLYLNRCTYVYDSLFLNGKTYFFKNEKFYSYERRGEALSNKKVESLQGNHCYLLRLIQPDPFIDGFEEYPTEDISLSDIATFVIPNEQPLIFVLGDLIKSLSNHVVADASVNISTVETEGARISNLVIDSYFRQIYLRLKTVKFSSISILLSGKILSSEGHVSQRLSSFCEENEERGSHFGGEHILFMPLFLEENEHFVFYVVLWTKKLIIIYDPLGHSSHLIKNRIWKFVCLTAYRRACSTEGWKLLDISRVHGCPKQTDSHSCGLFVMIIGTAILLGHSLESLHYDENEWRSFVLSVLRD